MPYVRNKVTGEMRFIPDAQPPADPTFPYKGQQAALEVQGKRADIQNDATRLQLERARLELAREQAMQQQALQQQQAAAEAIKAEQARKEAEARDPLNPGQLQSVADDAMSKLKTIDHISQTQRGSWLPTVGFGAETLNDIGGTGAADVAADVDTLKAGSALSEVLKMTQQTGKNPFTPMSNSDVDLIARNTGNLRQNQSPENFNRNLGNYKNAYVRAYAGSVGAQTLNGEIDRQIQKYTRENPSRTQRQEQAFRSVIQAKARQEYERRMRAGRPAQPRQPAAPSGAKFLGWED